MQIDLTQQVQKILPIANGGTGTSDGTRLPSFADNETPSGTVDGSNNVFSLANIPNPPASLQQFKGSSLMLQGIDYTLSQNTVTFTVPPASGSTLRAWYRWNVFILLLAIRGEQIFWSDGVNFESDGFKKFSDSMNMSDAFNWAYLLSKTGADTLSMSDSRLVGYGNFVTDVLSMSDAKALGYGVSLSDVLPILDSIAFALIGATADQLLLFDRIRMQDNFVLGYGLALSDQKIPFDAVVVHLA